MNQDIHRKEIYCFYTVWATKGLMLVFWRPLSSVFEIVYLPSMLQVVLHVFVSLFSYLNVTNCPNKKTGVRVPPAVLASS